MHGSGQSPRKRLTSGAAVGRISRSSAAEPDGRVLDRKSPRRKGRETTRRAGPRLGQSAIRRMIGRLHDPVELLSLRGNSPPCRLQSRSGRSGSGRQAGAQRPSHVQMSCRRPGRASGFALRPDGRTSLIDVDERERRNPRSRCRSGPRPNIAQPQKTTGTLEAEAELGRIEEKKPLGATGVEPRARARRATGLGA